MLMLMKGNEYFNNNISSALMKWNWKAFTFTHCVMLVLILEALPLDLFPTKNSDEKFYFNGAVGHGGGCFPIGITYDNDRKEVFQQWPEYCFKWRWIKSMVKKLETVITTERVPVTDNQPLL
jgi:hypothetical protein